MYRVEKEKKGEREFPSIKTLWSADKDHDSDQRECCWSLALEMRAGL
jgi:hypothetical protein